MKQTPLDREERDQSDRLVWRREEPDSPCQNICVIHPHAKICAGCYRSAEEISEWAKLDKETRAQVLRELPSRAGMLKARRRGGRQGRGRQAQGAENLVKGERGD